MTFLLDVNVLIALLDPKHIYHDAASEWFARDAQASWATCPITQNGLLRIVGGRTYPNSTGSPAAAAEFLRSLTSRPGHVFWPDEVSLLDAPVDPTLLRTGGQVTDSYLLALAVARGGKLATFDRRLSPAAVRGGKAALHVIPQIAGA